MKKIGITVLVVTIVIIAGALVYLAYIGLPTPPPNIGVNGDPTGQKRSPIAYATISVNCQVQNKPFEGWYGKITGINVATYPWVNGTQTNLNQMYNQKIDPLGFTTSNAHCHITTQITGPSNYISPLKTFSGSVKVNLVTGFPTSMNFGPLTAKFYDAGQYQIVVHYYLDDGRLLGTKTGTFTVVG